jgi:hypothetical protein
MNGGRDDAGAMGAGTRAPFRLYACYDDNSAQMARGDRILWREDAYLVLRAETVSLGREALYVQANLHRCEETHE